MSSNTKAESDSTAIYGNQPELVACIQGSPVPGKTNPITNQINPRRLIKQGKATPVDDALDPNHSVSQD